MFRPLLLTLTLLTACTSASALEVFGNGNLASNDNQGGLFFGAHDGWAIPFTTGNTTDADLRTVRGAWVLTGGSATQTTFSVKIYDAAGADGLAGPANTVPLSGSLGLDADAPIAWRYVSFGTPVELPQNGKYYFAVERTAIFGNNFKWSQPQTNATYSPLTAGSSYAITGGESSLVWGLQSSSWSAWVDPVSTTPMGFQIVPEPSTYALSLISAGTLGLMARRRRRISA